MNPIRVSCVLMLCATLVYGCDSPPPTVPSLPPPSPAPAPRTTLVHLSGLVLDDSEAPVANAEMRGLGGGNYPEVRTFTDASGQYELAGTVPYMTTSLVIKKPGYDDAEYFVVLETTQRNFHLYPSVTIDAGVSIPVVIKADDPSCGFDMEYLCRRVGVRAAERGTLLLDVTAVNAQVKPGLSVGPVPPLYELSSNVSVDIQPGSTLSVYVLRWWDDRLGSQRLTLTTRLQPR